MSSFVKGPAGAFDIKFIVGAGRLKGVAAEGWCHGVKESGTGANLELEIVRRIKVAGPEHLALLAVGSEIEHVDGAVPIQEGAMFGDNEALGVRVHFESIDEMVTRALSLSQDKGAAFMGKWCGENSVTLDEGCSGGAANAAAHANGVTKSP